MKSLDEQIEYMRKEVLWHRGQEPIKKDTKDTMKKTIIGDMTDKELNTLVCRAFKAGLSVEAVAWVFKIPVSDVHRIIREAL